MGLGLYKGFLESAKWLIKDKASWAQGCVALNAKGEQVQSYHPQAVRWSAFGAVCKAVPTSYIEDTGDLLLKAMNTLKPECHSVWEFNDTSTHGEVLAAFDLAIEGCS